MNICMPLMVAQSGDSYTSKTKTIILHKRLVESLAEA